MKAERDIAHASRCARAWKALAKRRGQERDEARRELALCCADELSDKEAKAWATREWGADVAARLFPEGK